ncbi:cupredoxin domain-containing protein [Acidobacteriota bacterium]
MGKREIIAILLVIICTAVAVLAVFAYRSHLKSPNTVELLARAPERGNWSPRILQVEKGKEINLVIKNVDTVTHGFYCPTFDLLAKEIKAGEVETLTFVADKEGEFPFYCAVWCSNHHMQMTGTLVVK